MTQSSGNVTVRLPGETRKKLDHIAADLDRSRNWLITQAIENYLEVYEWQEQKIRERLKKAESKGKFRTAKQVSRMVDSFKP